MQLPLVTGTKAKGARKAARSKKGKAGNQKAPSSRKRKLGAATTANAFLATDVDNDMISSKEIIGMREGPVRCATCNTDFASRGDFERHAIVDHPGIPARIAK